MPNPSPIRRLTVTRCPANPLITVDSAPTLGTNINGPSIIRVPAWIDEPLGTWYCYFAHHNGDHIRLAYADDLAGPWTVHEPGTLQLREAAGFHQHIASPDVHVDHAQQRLRMYFHGPASDRQGQWSGVALSADGLRWQPTGEILGKFYFRVWKWRDAWYTIAKDWNEGWGVYYRSPDGLTDFARGGHILERVRHTAVLPRGHQLLVFHSRKGDAPERILLSTIDMRADWRDWQATEPVEVLRPEEPWEGTGYPIEPSNYGSAIEVNQLRDPGLIEHDGQLYLFYSYAGEMGLAMANVDLQIAD